MDIETLSKTLEALTKELQEMKKAGNNPKKTTTKKETKQKKTIEIAEHKKSDIPTLIKAMDKDTLISTFGIMKNNTKDQPYHTIGISQFFSENNIKLTGFQRIGLSYNDKHLILVGQLKGETTKTQQKVRQTCLNYLQEKLKNIPETTRYGKPMTDKQRENMTKALQDEINRWS